MQATSGRPVQAEEVAAGALQIAVANMANAIKRISVARGRRVVIEGRREAPLSLDGSPPVRAARIEVRSESDGWQLML